MNDLWISILFRWLCVIALIWSGTALSAPELGTGIETEIEIATGSVVEGSADTRDFSSAPPHLQSSEAKPRVVISIDNSLAMLLPAYDTKYFDPQSGDGQVGYFSADKQYYYDSEKQRFYAVATLSKGNKRLSKSNNRLRDENAWDGRYLNWLTMRRIDIAKAILIGGAVRTSSMIKTISNTVLRAYAENTYEDKVLPLIIAINTHRYAISMW